MATEHVQDPIAWLVPVLPERSLAGDVYTSKRGAATPRWLGRSRHRSVIIS